MRSPLAVVVSRILALGCGLCCFGAATIASAAPEPADRSEPSFAGSLGYVYLSPAMFAIPAGDDDADALIDISYQWGFGGGAIFGVGKMINIGLGLGLEHAPLSLDGTFCNLVAGVGRGDCTARGHALRILPEFRLGAGRKRVMGYGYLSPGLAIVRSRLRADTSGFAFDQRDTDVGFNLGFGGGVQYLVWRRLAIGGELGFDLAFMSEKDDDDLDFGDPREGYGLYMLDLKVMASWWF